MLNHNLKFEINKKSILIFGITGQDGSLLAEQYLNFLDHAIKKDIDVAAEYLVMGAWLAFLKSKILIFVEGYLFSSKRWYIREIIPKS